VPTTTVTITGTHNLRDLPRPRHPPTPATVVLGPSFRPVHTLRSTSFTLLTATSSCFRLFALAPHCPSTPGFALCTVIFTVTSPISAPMLCPTSVPRVYPALHTFVVSFASICSTTNRTVLDYPHFFGQTSLKLTRLVTTRER
jgi:hypothetical protein